MITVNNIKLSLDDRYALSKDIILNNSNELVNLASTVLNLNKSLINNVFIKKESVDAREVPPFFVLTLIVELQNKDLEINILKSKKFSKYNIALIDNTENFNFIKSKKNSQLSKPVVIGFGPAGMFSSFILAEAGLEPIIIERGKKIEDRAKDINNFIYNKILNENSNVQFGEGGAGTFSDGKLSTGVKSKFTNFILKTLVSMGAPEDILYKSQPHIGTDKLRLVVKNIREYIESLGGSFRFNTKLDNLIVKNNKIIGIDIYNYMENNIETVFCDYLLLCIGHSARDTIEMLYNNGVAMEQKPFAIGLRIEHKQDDLDRSRYHEYTKHPALLPSSYNINVRTPDNRGVYSFCMCPGGEVIIASSEKEKLVVNGMSYHSRKNTNANSALLVGISPKDFGSDHVLSGISFQRKIEEKAFNLVGKQYIAPCQKVEDFMINKVTTSYSTITPSCKSGYKNVDLNDSLPHYVISNLKYAIPLFGNKIKCFKDYNAVLTGVETRSSSPIRILRNEIGCTNIAGLYGAGEGAGYAGGIMSAAIDGIRIANNIIENLEV